MVIMSITLAECPPRSVSGYLISKHNRSSKGPRAQAVNGLEHRTSKAGSMWWNKKRKLQHLFDELRGIAIMERLCPAQTDLTENDCQAHAMRQIRQTELFLEVQRLTDKERSRMSQEQKVARSRQKTSTQANREQDLVRLLERLEKLKRALDERDARIRRYQEPAAA
jgi:hypothetical protein